MFEAKGKAGQLFRWISGETAEFAPLRVPYGVAADGEGRVWVADVGSRLVHVYDLARGKAGQIAAAGTEGFLSPVAVACDASRRRLYVADTILNKVFVLDEKGRSLGTRLPPGGYQRPAALAVDGQGRLLVLDLLGGRVDIFDGEGRYLRRIEGVYDGMPLNRPTGLWVDGRGQIYIVDAMNFRVVVLGSDGEFVRAIGSLGDAPGHFARPRGVAVDGEGHVYVTDAAFDNVQVFDAEGRLLLHWGGAGDKLGRFSLPAGIFIDAHDRLYVADSYNRRIQVFQYLAQ
jgi:DNA-binding beta-propeller fold protein YncE